MHLGKSRRVTEILFERKGGSVSTAAAPVKDIKKFVLISNMQGQDLKCSCSVVSYQSLAAVQTINPPIKS